MEGTLDYRWQKNGMALGGIGAGSVEICQNGELREWDICNMANGEARMCGNRKSYMITTPMCCRLRFVPSLQERSRLYADFVMTGTTANFGH